MLNHVVGFLCVALISGKPSFAQSSHESTRTNVRYPQLRKELLEMEVNDQHFGNLFMHTLSQHPNDTASVNAAGKKMNSIYNRNTAALKKILHRYGWPGISLVGRKGAEAAFLIVQHSNDTLFQRACLPLLDNAYERGQVPGDAVALLTDRVLVREGKPQMYGT
ncbi:MAG: hypothetical protein JRN15_12255, partial [Nitrososphaerota archaeon]|nr:hypothetical protein [Nitrososphaerota archaeon]